MITTRYSPLVRLKKKSLDEAERQLVTVNNEAAAAAEKLKKAYSFLSTLSLPEYGTAGSLRQAQMMIQAQHNVIEQCTQMMKILQEKQEAVRKKFQNERIEYEKFKYLEVEEVNAHIKKMKTIDAKLLDEIGTMIHKREKK